MRKYLETLLNAGATDSLLPFTALLVVFALLIPITGFYINRIIAFSLFYLALGGWLAIAPTSTLIDISGKECRDVACNVSTRVSSHAYLIFTRGLIMFPPQDYAKNYGLVFTAYGMGALGGTLLAGRIRDKYLSKINLTFSEQTKISVFLICSMFPVPYPLSQI